jgi:Leucine-rich repeat (LRR) protein
MITILTDKTEKYYKSEIMKTIIIWMLMLTITSVSIAQNVKIPDANFKNALIEAGVDTSGDGEISYAEAEAVTNLSIRRKYISDMTGIEAFTNLKTLDCAINQLTSLDVSGCTNLTHIGCDANKLTSLNISGCNALAELNCSRNQLTDLDVSGYNALTGLWCHQNKLITLNTSGCSSLNVLNCSSNQLTSLDVYNNIALKVFDLSKMPTLEEVFVWILPFPPQGVNISISGSSNVHFILYFIGIPDTAFLYALINIGVDTDGDSLISINEAEIVTHLDVSNFDIVDLQGIYTFINLDTLICSNNSLTHLDLFNNINLISLSCNNNPLSSLNIANNRFLTDIDLSNIPSLYKVCVWTTPFPPGYVHIDTTSSPNVYFSAECFVNIPDIAFLYALIDEGVDINGDSLISFSEAEAVTSLNMRRKNISDMTGIEAFTNLKTLDCAINQLTSLDVSDCTILTHLGCDANKLTSLNISGCSSLKILNCSWNRINRLDVSGCGSLESLHCQNNRLTSLDVSTNTALENLSCGFNQLTYLDISKNTALKVFDFSHMPTLVEVCVWRLPFPPSGVNIIPENSKVFTIICYGNFIDIPDTSFLNALINIGVDTNGDSLITFYEAELISLLDVSNRGIADLQGI